MEHSHNEPAPSVRIIPLGGFDRMGMNMTLIECGETIIAIDCGVSFPPNNLPGIDTAIPDIGYLRKNRDKLKGIVVTHGHEDHIGAIPYLIEELGATVYGTPLTIALVENKLAAAGIRQVKTRVIRQGSTIVLGGLRVEFIRTSHSIPDAVMLAIYTPAGILVHTGDFKVDLTPATGDAIDLRRLGMLGSKGVLAVLSDSTNALRKGHSPSEKDVALAMDQLFNQNRGKRFLIAVFASNMDRVQLIIRLAEKYGRRVLLQGSTMLEIFRAAGRLGYLDIPDGIIIDENDVRDYADNELICIMAGSHGEPITYMRRIAEGTHDLIRIKEGDMVLFSSIAVPGSEQSFSDTINLLEERGAHVVFQDIHATGHACEEELRLIYSILSPTYAIPAHGEYRYRKAGAAIAGSIGSVREENIFLIKDGDVLELTAGHGEVIDHIPLKEVLVDGLGVGDVDRSLLSERAQMSDSGVVMIELCFEARTGRMLSDVNILSRGFVNEQAGSDIPEMLAARIRQEADRLIAQDIAPERREDLIREAAESWILENTGLKPVVLVSILKVML